MNMVILDDIRPMVRDIFAEVTRYPAEILEFDARLEEDLGIDSVKLGEVFSVLREKFHLPKEISIPPEKLRNIADISEALRSYLSTNGSPAANSDNGAPPMARVATNGTNGTASAGTSRSAIQEGVLKVFAEVTRYPADILDPAASLEEDLGIDSVKLGEIFSVLREKYELPKEISIPPEKLRNIASISEAIYDYLTARRSSTPRKSPDFDQVTIRDAKPVAPTVHVRSVLPPSTNGKSNGHAHEAVGKLAPAGKPFLGKVAFVSGSGHGLGKDIVMHLASLGASVVVNSFHSRSRGEETTAEIKSQGGDAVHLWGSMANPEQLHGIFDRIEELHGRLDFFISSASNGMLASVEKLTVEHWEKAFRTNVIGLHQGALRAATLMRRNGGGKIISMSSPAAHGYVEYFGCMGPVKAAVESLTRALAIEFAPYNIQVNCVSPGPIEGELLSKWPESKRLVANWRAATPYSRLCEHHDVSHFIAYLLSEPAKLFNGSVLVLDGGISAQGW